MPIPRLRLRDSALLVVDMQQRIIDTVVDADRVTNNCAILLRMADALGLPYLVTEQNPHGLGRTCDEVASAMTDQSQRLEKTRFSAAGGLLEENLHAWRRSSVIVAGIETHLCVLHTVLDLQAAGIQTFVCIDATSCSRLDLMQAAYDRMTGAGAILTGVVPALYELLEDSSHPLFKVCLQLAKMVR